MASDIFIAFDLGTTTLHGVLLDSKGAVLARSSTLNPQGRLASDILTRLELSDRGRGVELQSLLCDGIRALLSDLLPHATPLPGTIVRAAAAGNTAICHLLQNLPVASLIAPPYRPAQRGMVSIPPSALGLDLPVPFELFPSVSGYVGGDLVAFLMCRPLPQEPTLYVDIGTNAEIALFTGKESFVTSVAAGPAFEGGNISCGMPYGQGAVEAVRWDVETLHLRTVGAASPKGLSGRGLVELVAAALEGRLIDTTGRIVSPQEVPDNRCRYLVPSGEAFAFRFYRDASSQFLLTQEDVRNVQLAKGAVRAGIACLLERGGLREEDVRDVIMTGAFGVSLSAKSLKRVAMIPEKMVDKVRFLPDGVLEGLSRYLTEKGDTVDPEELAGRLRPFPLSGTPAFERAFLSSLDFQGIDQR